MEKRHQTLSQDITEKLTRRISSGVYPVGGKLPTERALAEEFGAARHVVREALKRLEAVGLLRIRQGSGIYVQELQFGSGAELFDIYLRNEDGSVNTDFLHDVQEFRNHIVRGILQLAVVRRTDEELQEMRGLFEILIRERADTSKRESAVPRLLELVTQAAHNKVYMQVFRTLGIVFLRMRELFALPQMASGEVELILSGLLQSFETRDVARADLLICRYLNGMDEILDRLTNGELPVPAENKQV